MHICITSIAQMDKKVMINIVKNQISSHIYHKLAF
jgi:hypothetical protein